VARMFGPARLAGRVLATGHRKNIAVAAIALVTALSGCASPRGPTLGDAISRGYPGHAELQPKLTVGEDAFGFPYTPGSLIFAVAGDGAGGSQSVLWTAETDFRCGHATPIGRLRSVSLRPYVIGTGAGASISARDRAQSWLSDSTGVSRGSLSGVSSVRIALTNVRRVAPGAKDLARLTRQAAADCPLAAIGGWKPVKSVLIGDVRVEIRFERSFSLGARLALLEQLQLSFGVGYQRISDRAILGRQVAFGVQWQ